MNWFSKLFKKNSQENSNINNELSSRREEGYDAFEKGQECYIKGQKNEALTYFDKAIECGFEENFKNDAAKLYGFRGECLQTLKFDYDAIKDFDKAISLSPYNCNNYFSRAFSKGSVLDYNGAIFDLKVAIVISKEDNELNRAYQSAAKKMGYGSPAEMFQMHLLRYEMALMSEKEYTEKVEKASTSESKEYWQKIINEERERKLERIKKRK